MDNESFTDDPQQETARILKKIASQLGNSLSNGILDANGNKIGNWSIQGKEMEHE
jgi:hypothetical protein